MIPEVGGATILVALILALYGAAAAALGGHLNRPALVASARNATLAQVALITLAGLLLEYAFITYDFSVKYVALNTTRGTPLFYRIGGLWGALEGSLLLWAWMLAIYTAIAAWLYRRRFPDQIPWVLAIMQGVLAFFLLVMTLPASPFERQFLVPTDGRGLNPLLEDTGMVTHPLFLYLGFTGYTVPYAFAMAALIRGKLNDEWIVSTRRWSILAWYFLSMGLLLGGWWSYHVLGWGGYWAWDPVENAAFMPWLTGTAFLHSVMIQERRRMLKVWNLTLIVLTFSLTLFGTFLTRSGVIASVHSFTQSAIGAFFLGFIGIVMIFSLALLAWRGDLLRAQGELDSLVSRESTFLLNNLFLVGAAFTVFLGTIFPLIAEAVRGVKMSVGTPFFNSVNVPIFLSLVFLMGVGPLIAWRRASLENLKRNFLYPLLIGAAGAVLLFVLGIKGGLALLSFGLAIFVTATIVQDFYKGTRARMRSGEALFAAMATLAIRNKRRYGGFIVHLGIILIAIGVTGSQAFPLQTEIQLKRGGTLDIGRYNLRFEGLSAAQESNHFQVTATLTALNQGKPIDVMTPGRKYYPSQQQPIAQVAYRSTLLEDLYVVLGDFEQDGSAAIVKAMVNPLVIWIWIGGGVITLGTLLAVWPDRRKGAA